MNRHRTMVEELRRLIKGPCFRTAANYFLNKIARQPEIQVDSLIRRPRIESALKASIRQRTATSKSLHVLMGQFGRTPLLHGMVQIGESFCGFFYFEDEDIGLIILSSEQHPGMTEFVRLSLFEVAGNARLSPGPKLAS